MTKKEKFMTFVYLAAIARDLSHACCESAQIALYATRIPERQIPLNPMNAAHVYMAYLEGRSKPFNWMRPADLQRISKSEAVRNNAVEASEKIIVT